MIQRRLLYLDTQRLTAYAWKQGRLFPEGVFEVRPDEVTRFGAYLKAHNKSQFQLLVNVPEEGHELETIPFLQGADRKALITRKLGQHFLGSPLSTAISLGYEKNKRKNEKLLLSALTNPAHFEPWLAAFAEADAPLVGLYTITQLAGILLRKLDKDTDHALLLTYQDHSVRESFVSKGTPLFSRMVPLLDSSVAGIASRFASEASKLHQYLVGRRQVRRNDVVPVFVLTHPNAQEITRQACTDNPSLHFEVIDSHWAAKRLGLKTLPVDASSELIFLHLLATAPPAQQFAAESHRHDYRISQIRQALIAIIAIALIGGMLFSLKHLFDAYRLDQETQAINENEAELNWRYREISATFPQLGIDKETLRRITDQERELLKSQRTPYPALREISQALNEMPSVYIDEFTWELGKGIQGGGGWLKGARGDDVDITTLRGTLRLGPGSTPRQALSTFDHFVELLSANKNADVAILQHPIDVESGRALKGGDMNTDEKPVRQFAVQITRKLTP